MQNKTAVRPARRVKQFVETVADAEEFDQVVARDYNPADGETFVLMAWNPGEEGREQMTKLQHKVTGVDKRFEGIDLDYVNLARGYAKFEAEL